MLRIYCPVCNGLLRLEDGQREAVCVNCGTRVAVPQGYTEAESSYLFAAEAMQRRDFEGAYQTYTEILSAHPEQAEAHFKRALALYEIEYQEIGEGRRRLVCHQAGKANFLGNADVKQALELSEGTQKELYEKQAAEIHALQKQVSAHAKAHPPVDVWLSVAGESLASLNRAVQIRQLLDSMGLSVFCPALDLAGEEESWEPALYRAASTASVMVVVASEGAAFTDEVNFDAERFLYRKEKALREAKGQIPALLAAFENIDEYEDIPDSYFDGIDVRLDMSRESFAAELKSTVQEALADYRGALKEQAGTHESFAYANLLLQARQALEGGSFEEAKEQYQSILLKSPAESQAYWGLLLAKRECTSEEALIQSGKRITQEADYRSALAFASEREQQTYRDVAARTNEMAAVHEEQERKRRQQAREQEEERKKKGREVEEAGKRKQWEEAEARKRRANRFRAFVAVMALAVIGGAAGWFIYSKSPAGVKASQYREAQTAYSHGLYEDAYALYAELGDYKDSAQMARTCMGRQKQIDYNTALTELDDMSRRASAISTIMGAEGYVQEVEAKLEEIHAEGVQYLQEGKLYEAWNTLEPFGTSDPYMVKAWRIAFGRSLLSGGGENVAAVAQDGTLTNYGTFPFEGRSALSVSFSDSGSSAGAVRLDGTAYLLGNISGLPVSGWSDLVAIKVSDSFAAGLTSGGDLYAAGAGLVASDVVQFDLDGNYLAAVRSDGSVYCTNPAAAVPGDWSGIAYVALVGDGLLAVTEDGTLLQSGCAYGLPDSGVGVVYHGCGRLGVLTLDGEQICIGLDGEDDGGSELNPGSAGYFAAFTIAPSHTVNLATDGYGRLLGQIYGNSVDDAAMRNAIQDFPDVDVPNPYPAESEGGES